jgi:hypothetical protein
VAGGIIQDLARNSVHDDDTSSLDNDNRQLNDYSQQVTDS